jgi:hypothetical protein
MIFGSIIKIQTSGLGSLEVQTQINLQFMDKLEFHMKIILQVPDTEDVCGKQIMVPYGYLVGMEDHRMELLVFSNHISNIFKEF